MPGGVKAVIRDGDRWWPFISAPPASRRTESHRHPFGSTSPWPAPFAAPSEFPLFPLTLWTFVTFGGSYQSANVAVTPKRSPRRRPDCVIDFRCLLSSLNPHPSIARYFALLRCDLMESSAHPCQHAPLIFHSAHISATFGNAHCREC